MAYRNYSITNGFTVSKTIGEGDFTTITAACAVATTGTVIGIMGGAYTENFTLPGGVVLTNVADNSIGYVNVIGKITYSAAENSAINGIQLITNGDYCLVYSGSGAGNLVLSDCNIQVVDNAGINFTNSNSNTQLFLDNTSLTTLGNYAPFVMTSVGVLQIQYCIFTNSVASTVASTSTNGIIRFIYSEMYTPLITSSGNRLEMICCTIDCSNINTTALTIGGNGNPNRVYYCSVYGGSASGISIGSQALIYYTLVNSSAVNAITGAGTITFEDIQFPGSSSTINTSTQVSQPLNVQQGGTGRNTLTTNALLAGNTQSAVSLITTANNAILATNGSGVPSITTASGNWLNTTRTAFLAYLPSSDNNVTGDGTVYTLGATTALTEVFDQDNNFNTNGTFTAPVTGRYQLSSSIRLFGGSAILVVTYSNVTSNRTYIYVINNLAAAGISQFTSPFSQLCDMDAADTYTVTISTIDSGGKVDDALGSASFQCGMSGYLVC